MSEMFAGGVAVEDLDQEERDRRQGVQRAVAPDVPSNATGIKNTLELDELRHRLDAAK